MFKISSSIPGKKKLIAELQSQIDQVLYFSSFLNDNEREFAAENENKRLKNENKTERKLIKNQQQEEYENNNDNDNETDDGNIIPTLLAIVKDERKSNGTAIILFKVIGDILETFSYKNHGSPLKGIVKGDFLIISYNQEIRIHYLNDYNGRLVINLPISPKAFSVLIPNNLNNVDLIIAISMENDNGTSLLEFHTCITKEIDHQKDKKSIIKESEIEMEKEIELLVSQVISFNVKDILISEYFTTFLAGVNLNNLNNFNKLENDNLANIKNDKFEISFAILDSIEDSSFPLNSFIKKNENENVDEGERKQEIISIEFAKLFDFTKPFHYQKEAANIIEIRKFKFKGELLFDRLCLQILNLNSMGESYPPCSWNDLRNLIQILSKTLINSPYPSIWRHVFILYLMLDSQDSDIESYCKTFEVTNQWLSMSKALWSADHEKWPEFNSNICFNLLPNGIPFFILQMMICESTKLKDEFNEKNEKETINTLNKSNKNHGSNNSFNNRSIDNISRNLNKNEIISPWLWTVAEGFRDRITKSDVEEGLSKLELQITFMNLVIKEENYQVLFEFLKEFELYSHSHSHSHSILYSPFKSNSIISHQSAALWRHFCEQIDLIENRNLEFHLSTQENHFINRILMGMVMDGNENAIKVLTLRLLEQNLLEESKYILETFGNNLKNQNSKHQHALSIILNEKSKIPSIEPITWNDIQNGFKIKDSQATIIKNEREMEREIKNEKEMEKEIPKSPSRSKTKEQGKEHAEQGKSVTFDTISTIIPIPSFPISPSLENKDSSQSPNRAKRKLLFASETSIRSRISPQIINFNVGNSPHSPSLSPSSPFPSSPTDYLIKPERRKDSMESGSNSIKKIISADKKHVQHATHRPTLLANVFTNPSREEEIIKNKIQREQEEQEEQEKNENVKMQKEKEKSPLKMIKPKEKEILKENENEFKDFKDAITVSSSISSSLKSSPLAGNLISTPTKKSFKSKKSNKNKSGNDNKNSKSSKSNNDNKSSSPILSPIRSMEAINEISLDSNRKNEKTKKREKRKRRKNSKKNVKIEIENNNSNSNSPISSLKSSPRKSPRLSSKERNEKEILNSKLKEKKELKIKNKKSPNKIENQKSPSKRGSLSSSPSTSLGSSRHFKSSSSSSTLSSLVQSPSRQSVTDNQIQSQIQNETRNDNQSQTQTPMTIKKKRVSKLLEELTTPKWSLRNPKMKNISDSGKMKISDSFEKEEIINSPSKKSFIRGEKESRIKNQKETWRKNKSPGKIERERNVNVTPSSSSSIIDNIFIKGRREKAILKEKMKEKEKVENYQELKNKKELIEELSTPKRHSERLKRERIP